MLTRVRVEKFRSIKSGISVNLMPLNLVVGINNSGKSSFLELFRLLSVDSIFDFLMFHSSQKSDGGQMGYMFSHSENYYYPDPVKLLFDAEDDSYAISISRRGYSLIVSFYRNDKFVCDIVTTTTLSAIKFYWPEDGQYKIDWRSIRKAISSQYAIENFGRLRDFLNFTKRIEFHNCSRDDQSLLNDFEVDLMSRLKPKRSEFLREVCDFFGMPNIEHLEVNFYDGKFVPSGKEMESAKIRSEEINIAIEHIKKLRQEIGSRRWIGEILKHAEALKKNSDVLSEKSVRPGYGGLTYGRHLRLASELGSGYRSLLLICLKIELGDLILLDEPESFLHPELQLRLCEYISMKIAEGKQFVITSHSGVIMNYFFNNSSYGIVETDGSKGEFHARGVDNRIGILQAMDVLGIRASQILQSNCIVWVEGPSDRIYIKCWIDIWSGGRLKEGEHYSCVFYGGSLLKHLTAEKMESEIIDRLDLLRINQKVIFVVDSDRSSHGGRIDDNKKFILDRIQNGGGIAIVTYGRTIENYIPKRLIERFFDILYDENFWFIGTEDIFKLIKKELRIQRDKVSLANHIAKNTSPADLLANIRLLNVVEQLCSKIYEWNRLEHSSRSDINPNVVLPKGEDLASKMARGNNILLLSEVRKFTGLGILESKKIVERLRELGFETSKEVIKAVLAKLEIDPSDKICQEIRLAIEAGIRATGERDLIAKNML